MSDINRRVALLAGEVIPFKPKPVEMSPRLYGSVLRKFGYTHRGVHPLMENVDVYTHPQGHIAEVDADSKAFVHWRPTEHGHISEKFLVPQFVKAHLQNLHPDVQ